MLVSKIIIINMTNTLNSCYCWYLNAMCVDPKSKAITITEGENKAITWCNYYQLGIFQTMHLVESE